MELVIRPARTNEVAEIWDLLHANLVPWTDAKIISELPKIWVMLRNSKMLGVLWGDFEPGKMKIKCVAVHPFYPEKQLRETMFKGIDTIFGLDRNEAWIALRDYMPVLEL